MTPKLTGLVVASGGFLDATGELSLTGLLFVGCGTGIVLAGSELIGFAFLTIFA